MGKKKELDLTGQRFGRLTVAGFSHKENSYYYYNCLCDCSEGQGERPIIKVKSKYLKSGDTRSCGCLKKEHLKIVREKEKTGNKRKHPKKQDYSKLFYKSLKNIWNTLINRCHNKNYKGYKNYGAKGIYVCDEWRFNFMDFYYWSIENGYLQGYSLDRLSNEKNYNPDNCEWVEIPINCGTTKNCIPITIRNKTQTAAEWAKEHDCEVSASTILERYKKGIRGTKLIKKRQTLKDKKVEIEGQIKTLEEWAKCTDISIETIKQRYRRGLRGKGIINPITRMKDIA